MGRAFSQAVFRPLLHLPEVALERPPRSAAEQGLRTLSLGHSEAVFGLRLHLPENRS